MTLSRLFLVGGIAIAVAASNLGSTEASEMKEGSESKLHKTLSAFAKKNGLTDRQMGELLGGLSIGGVKLRKGGVGIVDDKLFILLDEKRNTLVIGNEKWQGKSSIEHELVLVADGRVIKSIQQADVTTLTIIIFSEKEVRYINLGRNIGGRYIRSSNAGVE